MLVLRWSRRPRLFFTAIINLVPSVSHLITSGLSTSVKGQVIPLNTWNKPLKKNNFSSDKRHDNHIFVKSNMTGIVAFLNFPSTAWTKKHLMCFQSGKAVFNFLWRSVDWALLVGHEQHYSLTKFIAVTLVSNRHWKYWNCNKQINLSD